MLGFPCLDGNEERENEPNNSDSFVPSEAMKPMRTRLLGWLGFFFFFFLVKLKL